MYICNMIGWNQWDSGHNPGARLSVRGLWQSLKNDYEAIKMASNDDIGIEGKHKIKNWAEFLNISSLDSKFE